MYAIYKQLHPPTGIEHCVYCNFINATELNLVVAAVNQIHVYRLYPETEVRTHQTFWNLDYFPFFPCFRI